MLCVNAKEREEKFGIMLTVCVQV